MIITENLIINGKDFIRTYSDRGYMVERDGAKYDEAIDPVEFGRVYTESTTLVEDMTETEEKAAAYDVLMGVSE